MGLQGPLSRPFSPKVDLISELVNSQLQSMARAGRNVVVSKYFDIFWRILMGDS
jgi:hypothetical protein